MIGPGLGGLMWQGRGQSAFSEKDPTAPNQAGNNLPPNTGRIGPSMRPGPTGQGQSPQGGQLGVYDGNVGNDPRADQGRPLQPWPLRFVSDWSKRPGPGGTAPQHPHYGTNGFNDKLTVKDRHAYWDTGNQKTGTDPPGSGGMPNTRNDVRSFPPMPNLRTVNRTVSYQKGTDTTRNQDDLARPYTWVGEQGSGWTPVYGGVPGLYQPYGTRGGVPYAIVSPAELGQPGDGPHLVFSGPPHGLHSQTPWKGGAQIISRFSSIPQTRPVRQDRPSNSPQAGQSYSQTVVPQGASPVRPGGGRAGFTGAARGGGLQYPGGRPWGGQHKPGQVAGSQNWLNAWGRRGPL